MSTIYHYCDISAFFNIVRSKKLWLSAANNLNDSQEVNWFIEKVYTRLSQMVTTKNREFLQEFWQHRSINSPMPYICSFSNDGDLLSQWRAYAGDGTGVAIGFNRKHFPFNERMPSPNISAENSVGLMNVIYDDVAQNYIIDEALKILEAHTDDEQEKFDKYSKAALLINQFSYLCKNPAFKEEDEVRIVHTPLITGNKNGETTVYGGISDIQYRVCRMRLTSYFELDFSVAGEIGPVVEVMLGPKCKISRFDIEAFLSTNGLGQVPYKISTASYR